MIKIIFIMIYLMLVLRVYSLSSYYYQLDSIRWLSWFAPLFVLYTIIYMLYRKQYKLFKESMLHPYLMYTTISMQFLLDMKKKIS